MPAIRHMRIDRRKKESLWLAEHARKVTSQNGEDGIIEKIFDVIGTRNKWCVEFGAWDGITHSNTYNLIANHGWSSLQIEAKSERFAELVKTHEAHPKVVCVNALIGFDPRNDSLEYHLRRARAPLDIDLAVIDIDGNDWHVWQSMARYRPRLLVIEFNTFIPNDVYFVQDRDLRINQGCSLRALIEFGKRRNYELVCAHRGNAFFVETTEFPKFGISDNSIDAMWMPDRDASLFLLYDGTLVNVGLSKVSLRQADQMPREIGPFAFQIYSEEERGFGDRTEAPATPLPSTRGKAEAENRHASPERMPGSVEPPPVVPSARLSGEPPARIYMPDGMTNTPFASERWLSEMGAVRVDSMAEAEFVVAMRFKDVAAVADSPAKTYLLWTHEPFLSDTALESLPLANGGQVHVFNVHNGRVYTDNYFYCDGAGEVPLLEDGSGLNTDFADKTVSVAAAMRDWQLVVEGMDRSLCRKRAAFALDLYRAGQAKIIGKNWPDGVATGDSRYFQREHKKTEFLRTTNFNLCPENTDADFYVTEKIWEAIAAGCLPIYHANGTIYQSFPPSSFVDMRSFKDGRELGAFLAAMSFEEYKRRINACREIFNRGIRENLRQASWQRTIARMRRFFQAHRKPADT
jgi:hypothetical protein